MFSIHFNIFLGQIFLIKFWKKIVVDRFILYGDDIVDMRKLVRGEIIGICVVGLSLVGKICSTLRYS